MMYYERVGFTGFVNNIRGMGRRGPCIKWAHLQSKVGKGEIGNLVACVPSRWPLAVRWLTRLAGWGVGADDMDGAGYDVPSRLDI